MTKYMSLEQQLRLEAEYQARKAQAYIATGELDRAIGCLNKAVAKIKRADSLKLGPLEEAIFGPMINELSNRIIKSIMEGKG